MTPAIWIYLGLALVMTVWIFVQASLVGRFAKIPGARRWGLFWFFVPFVAPIEAARSGGRILTGIWLTLAIGYAVLIGLA